MTTYELWDTESANLLADFPTEEAALLAVRDALRRYGPDALQGWELARAADNADTVSLLRGEALLARAVAAPDTTPAL